MEMPCKDCICLAICIAQINQNGSLLLVIEQCSTIKDYTLYHLYNDIVVYNVSRFDEIEEFFGLKSRRFL